MEMNIPCVVAGVIAGVGFAAALLTKGGFRNLVFLFAGFFFGTWIVKIPLEGHDHSLMLVAMLTGLMLFAVPYILHKEKQAEEEELERRTTPREDTRATLNRIFRQPPADK